LKELNELRSKHIKFNGTQIASHGDSYGQGSHIIHSLHCIVRSWLRSSSPMRPRNQYDAECRISISPMGKLLGARQMQQEEGRVWDIPYPWLEAEALPPICHLVLIGEGYFPKVSTGIQLRGSLGMRYS
jgi:hypothetical protein